MSDTVTLSRAEYEALVERAEDLFDLSLLGAAEAREAAMGKAQSRANALSMEEADRLFAGEHPVRVWREHRSVTLDGLAVAADLAIADLGDIEMRARAGTFAEMRALAKALDISLDDLAAWA